MNKLENRKIDICEDWFDIIEAISHGIWIEGEKINPVIDRDDVEYIASMMEEHPKFQRLMPDIILEVVNQVIEEF